MNDKYYEYSRDMSVLPWATLSDCRPDVAAHFHYMIEIIYAIDGGMRVNVDNNWFTMKENDYICINSGVPHATTNRDGARHYIVSIPKYVLMPSLQMMKNNFYYERDNAAMSMRDLIKCLKDNGDGIIKETEFRRKEPQNKIFLISLANSIISFFKSKNPDSITHVKREDSFLEIIGCICENYRDSSIKPSELATRFGYTTRMLSDMFAANLKTSPRKYINILRVNDAKFQLLSTPDSVDVISARAGFESVRSFYRVFEEHTGVSPGKYRDSFRK